LNKIAIFTLITAIITGCAPFHKPKPKPDRPRGTPIRTVKVSYGNPPINYKQKIKKYFSKRLPRGELAKYEFSKPQRAYKRKPLAYGNGIEWRGWIVDVLVSIPNRYGKYLKPKPYMVLFKNSQIIGDIVGSKHILITRVDSGKL